MRMLKQGTDLALCRVSSSWRAKRKYEMEAAYWSNEYSHLSKWFIDGACDWWGIPPPSAGQKLTLSESWSVNAVMTMHELRPSYTEELRIERDHFVGKRVLEVGCGPLAPVLQFLGCERHAIDPLANTYMGAGWPLYSYDAKILSIGGESLPYPDSYFDAAISVNALDHVDNFEQVASEMQRVVKVGGVIRFEVEYHKPAEAEPIALTDERVAAAFRSCQIAPVIRRTGREMFEALANRFGLLQNQLKRFGNEQFVTWHAVRNAR